jgi:hypothetical protein
MKVAIQRAWKFGWNDAYANPRTPLSELVAAAGETKEISPEPMRGQNNLTGWD